MRKLSKRSMTLVAATTAALTAAGVASAYYLTDLVATGTGAASTAANASASITWTTSSVTGLVPGGTAKTSTVTFTNPNAYAVNYASKTISVTSVSGATGCDLATSLIHGSAVLPAGVLAAGATTTLNVPISMDDSTTVDQTPCAGKTLTLGFAAA
jgi:hypothetical protein